MPILSIVDATTAAILGGVGGLLVGAVAMLALRLSERSQHLVAPASPQPNLPAGVADVLAVLRSSGIVVDSADAVVKASPSAVALGLVRETELVHAELRHLARQVRRDFVANVSHELKTPVGGLALLAEAVEGAADDPEAVERFAQRMRVEATRLTRLVQEIVDLSRLQVADTLHEPVIVDVAEVAAEAVERSRLVADAKGIEIATALDEGVHVFGDRELLITAVSNLVGNAIAYSGNDTKVAVAVHDADHGIVEVAVTDQGQGIPEDEQQRIFERFYRVDPARSRATGGTGLGLAIVKHVCANHGGEVTVWSEEGRGSTFTMRLPAAPESAADTHSSPNTEAAPAAPVTREVTR